jgi:DNA-binding response OmpR family regulator
MSIQRPILLLDDERHVTRALSYLLGNHSFTCITSNSPNNVMQIMENENPLVVLLDVTMPGTDGFEVCKQVRAQEKFADTKIIMLSGIGQKEHIERAYELGADDYMLKPFSPMELLDKIKNIYGVD